VDFTRIFLLVVGEYGRRQRATLDALTALGFRVNTASQTGCFG